MKTVLADASSLILLFRVGLFPALISFFRTVLAESVYGEVTVKGYPGAELFEKACADGHLLVRSTGLDSAVRFPELLMPSQAVKHGEGDTIRLWLAGEGDFLLMDDYKGAVFCRNHGIPYISAILFPRILRLTGHFSPDECAEKTDQIVRNGRYSKKIIAYARNCPDGALLFFSGEPAEKSALHLTVPNQA
ncbi:MAG: hypothetical protein R2941_25920 [Desulfobacterales bacterium]